MFMSKIVLSAVVLTAFSLSSGTAFSAAVPLSSGFGTLAGTEFGGDGIPNTDVQFATFDLGNDDVLTLGLSATPRFTAPLLSNDGAGTFTAKTGTTTSGSGLVGATWNFSYFIGLSDSSDGDITASLEDLGIELRYDFDPGKNTPTDELGTLSGPVFPFISTLTPDPATSTDPTTKIEGSQNLLFGFLGTDTAGFIEAPDFSIFSALVTGEYSFQLNATNIGGETGGVAITVNAVPIPAAAPLFISALAAAGVYRRFKTKKA